MRSAASSSFASRCWTARFSFSTFERDFPDDDDCRVRFG
jgi:hypothetical protein